MCIKQLNNAVSKQYSSHTWAKLQYKTKSNMPQTNIRQHTGLHAVAVLYQPFQSPLLQLPGRKTWVHNPRLTSDDQRGFRSSSDKCVWSFVLKTQRKKHLIGCSQDRRCNIRILIYKCTFI